MGRAEVARQDRTGNPGTVAPDVAREMAGRNGKGRHEKMKPAVSRNASCTHAASPRW